MAIAMEDVQWTDGWIDLAGRILLLHADRSDGRQIGMHRSGDVRKGSRRYAIELGQSDLSLAMPLDSQVSLP